jgi:hypothetical protein
MTYSPNGRKPYRGQKSALSPGWPTRYDNL